MKKPSKRTCDIGSGKFTSAEIDQRVIDDIKQFGWHCMSVLGGPETPGFTYTVGLYESYGHPEMLVYGLPPEVAHGVLSNVANLAAEGKPLDLDRASDALVEDYLCEFVKVPEDRYDGIVNFCLWYYTGKPFPLYQIVWPSVAGLFPWDAGADDFLKKVQPVLGKRRPPTQ